MFSSLFVKADQATLVLDRINLIFFIDFKQKIATYVFVLCILSEFRKNLFGEK